MTKSSIAISLSVYQWATFRASVRTRARRLVEYLQLPFEAGRLRFYENEQTLTAEQR